MIKAYLLIFFLLIFLLLPQNVFARTQSDTPCGNTISGYSIDAVKKLAGLIYKCRSHIGFYNVDGINSRNSFYTIVNTGKQHNKTGYYNKYGRYIINTSNKNCGADVKINADLLRMLLHMTGLKEVYAFSIGAVASNHDCSNGPHPDGRAVDINIVNGVKIYGYNTTKFGNSSNSDLNTIKKFYRATAAQMKSLGLKGSMGQLQCFRNQSFTTEMKNIYKNINFFGGDSCDHIHINVAR